METDFVISSRALVSRLFCHATPRERVHIATITQVCEGILGSKSTLLTNIARVIFPTIILKIATQRLSRILWFSQIPWDELRERMLEIAAQEVGENDYIAFDPGDLGKPLAKKMEGLYRVHDGSTGECVNGYECFSAEVISHRGGRAFHFPLYQKIITARCDDYISQNAQICTGIYAILDHVLDRGIWLFDRGHDRSIIFKKVFLIKTSLRFVLRSKENRVLKLDDGSEVKIFDHVTQLLGQQSETYQIKSPKKSGYLKVAQFRGHLQIDGASLLVTIIGIQDIRNSTPVVLITPLQAFTDEDILKIFTHYLQRWGKEEGYRFEKSFLNLENIRTQKLEAIQNLALLVQLVYLWVALTYKAMPNLLEASADRELSHEIPIQEVQYRYYRIAQLMRHRLFKQHPERATHLASLTEVA